MTLLRISSSPWMCTSWTLHITKRIWTCCSIAAMYFMIYCNHWVIEDFLWNEQTLTISLGVTIVPQMTSRIGRESPGSLMVMLSATIHALTVGQNHSSSMCKLINLLEASKWVNSASYRCMETRLVMRRMRGQKKQIVLAVTTPSVLNMMQESRRGLPSYLRPSDRKYEGKPLNSSGFGY
jgi:hypothetical protein